VRKRGSDEPFRVGDRVHLGSDTKAMTATMLATLVEEGRLDWSSTIAEVFSGRASSLHPEFRGVTLWQLLTHRAGLPHDGPWWDLAGKTPTEKRRDLLKRMMARPPKSRPGTVHEYSNAGYAIAGLMGEQVTGQAWEELMRQRVFEPLGMETAGFGPPGTRAALDEPWGHQADGTPLQADNAPALGPAGTVHASMPDWSRFISLHLRGERPLERGAVRLLEPQTFRRLHTPAPGTDYAAGWVLADRSWAGGRALNHNGSNTMWYCSAWLAPARDFAVLTATNQGGGAAPKACDESCESLIRLALTSGAAPARKARGGRGGG
jgi:CubicO group peptidase (beta-lactamase class C family)